MRRGGRCTYGGGGCRCGNRYSRAPPSFSIRIFSRVALRFTPINDTSALQSARNNYKEEGTQKRASPNPFSDCDDRAHGGERSGGRIRNARLHSADAPHLTVSTQHHPSASFLAEARQALVSYLSHRQPRADLVTTGRNTSAVSSYNWSGYADASTTPGTFTRVSRSWTTPSVTCTAEDTIVSDWVGIDGFNDSTVEQDGTIGWCFKNVPTHFTWYEMYPAGTVEVGSSLLPGDKIAASVTRSGTTYTLKLTDSTHTGNNISFSTTCPLTTCLAQSAEWVAERPAFSIGIAPQANYHTFTMTAGSETANGTKGTISSFSPSYEMTMIDATATYNLSTPSALTSGTKFTTKWNNSY
jgi:Peptidase A4 family